MKTMLEDIEIQLPDADLNGIHDLLAGTKDYARRIHWWVRLFGIVWIVAPLVAAGLASLFLLAAIIVGSI
jgi:hypothetical protein